jgi:hypothetical protein
MGNRLANTPSINPHKNGPFLRPDAGWPKMIRPCSVFSPADPKILSKDTNKTEVFLQQNDREKLIL